jgi:hypothetical protein
LYHILPFASRSVFDDEMPCPEFAAYNFISVYLSVIRGMTVFQRTFFTKDDIFLGFCLPFGQIAVRRNAGNRKPGRKILNIFL